MKTPLPTQLPCLIHATCVAVGMRGLLIVGPSGSGKSSLALQMMALGASLVSDDQCVLQEIDGAVFASRPEQLPPAIEARGLGILAANCQADACIAAVLDMTDDSQNRLPERRTCSLGSQKVHLLQNPVNSHGPAALYLYLKAGFHD